ncbi:MAG: BTAD domain-containing putative transcriptional regulator [Capsulimonas sp.]|uniref:AfsR/SARP family transcriptional regulator n=1 Tax=Capsulimonas sp. TaxID=2494211 RepID=UPI003266FCEC
MLQIQLLGDLVVPCPGGANARFETRRAASLLAFLAVHRRRSHPREELIEMLWPDEDADATRIRFRQVLSTLRRTLESACVDASDLLIADRVSVRLSADVSTDVSQFEDAMASASRADTAETRVKALRRAVDAYGGELLPGYYDDWVLGERRRLEEEYLTALSRLAQALSDTGDRDQALEYARKAVRLDPLREESHADVIRVLAADGRIAEALRQFRDLEQVLWKELRAMPGAEIQTLIEPLRSAPTLVFAPAPVAETAPPSGTPVGADAPRREIPIPPIGGMPTRLTRFFGRQTEIETLSVLLTSAIDDETSTRLLTLVGSGGLGKTRLALEVARRVAAHFPGGVWFTPLTDVGDASLLVSAIADSLRPGPPPGGDLWEHCLTRLGGGRTLLVLDGMEHLVDEGAQTVRMLLEQREELTCLVTSRRRLNLGGEQDYPVSPLPAPNEFEEPDLAALTPSMQLFLDRARQVSPQFALTPANQATVAALCRRLEGIPLALELAAGWAGALTPAQMLPRLSQRFNLLVSRRADMDARHRSLRATLEWSCERLDPELRQCFARLAVFRGGWTLEAAEEVCEEPQAFDILSQLGQHSLLVTDTLGEEIRFSMLETLREYAWEQLLPDEALPLNRRHAQWRQALAEEAAPKLTGPDQILWLDRLDAEAENLRAALHWRNRDGLGRSTEDNEAGLSLAGCSWRFWDVRGHHEEGLKWLETFLTYHDDAVPTLARVRALEAAGSLELARREPDRARPWLEDAVAAARALGDQKRLASALCSLGECLCDGDDIAAARAAFDESQTLFQSTRDHFGSARTLAGGARIALRSGDYQDAQSLADRSAAMHRIAGNLKGMAGGVHMNGVAALRLGDLPTARKRLAEGLLLWRQLGDKLGMRQAQTDLDSCDATPVA